MKRRIKSVRLRSERPRGRRPRAFTLVELLVVIAIIGMLMALLIPAVQMARESARRATCSNNQKNIGLAMMNFATARQRMPSGFSEVVDPANANNVYCASWVVPLLPYIEQKPLYDRIQKTPIVLTQTSSVSLLQPLLSVLMCPTRGNTGGDAPLSYVVNAGMTDNYAPANGTPLDYQANGVFFDHYSPFIDSGTYGPRIITDLSYVSDHDGTSSTILFSENNDATEWMGAKALTPATAPTPGNTWWQGIVWKLPPMSVDPVFPNFLNKDSSVLAPPTNTDEYLAKPTSSHPGIFLVTMVDGHTIAVSENIDYRVYVMAMAPWNSPQTITPNVNYYPGSSNAVQYPATWIVNGNLVPVTDADLTK